MPFGYENACHMKGAPRHGRCPTTGMSTFTITCDVPVFYATSEGQTKRIAERIVDRLRAAGLVSSTVDLAGPDAGRIDWHHVRAAVVGASLHAGRHQRAAVRFVRDHAEDLNDHPSVFFSVSLSAASEHEGEVRAARRIAQAFPAAHGWRPGEVATIAGRLAYTQYGFLKRSVMKWIARKEGAPTDTSRDYELTNWSKVDRLADDIAARIEKRVA
jgi:menaquinone-dependent protoporphyrinogen oxidase